MKRYNPAQQSWTLTFPIFELGYWSHKRIAQVIFLLDLALVIVLLHLMSGCSSPSPHRIQSHFESEPQASTVIKGKLSAYSQDRLPVGLAIVLHADSSQAPMALTEKTWPQFAARVNHKVQGLIPVTMKEVVQLDEIPSGERDILLKGMGENSPIEMVLVVLPSGHEVKGPAHFDVLPEVGTLNGHQTENHATVELGLLDFKSGKLLLQSKGTSYATLEQLTIPLGSNRYPRVRGSAMTSPIYPEEGKALETLRMVALNEALDQAVMKLSGKWHEGQDKSSSLAGGES